MSAKFIELKIHFILSYLNKTKIKNNHQSQTLLLLNICNENCKNKLKNATLNQKNILK